MKTQKQVNTVFMLGLMKSDKSWKAAIGQSVVNWGKQSKACLFSVLLCVLIFRDKYSFLQVQEGRLSQGVLLPALKEGQKVLLYLPFSNSFNLEYLICQDAIFGGQHVPNLINDKPNVIFKMFSNHSVPDPVKVLKCRCRLCSLRD